MDIGWYGQVRVDIHHEFKGPHAVLAGISSSAQLMGRPQVEAVDVALEAYYLFHTEDGWYVSPGFKTAYSFIEDRFVGYGTVNFGVTK